MRPFPYPQTKDEEPKVNKKLFFVTGVMVKNSDEISETIKIEVFAPRTSPDTADHYLRHLPGQYLGQRGLMSQIMKGWF